MNIFNPWPAIFYNCFVSPVSQQTIPLEVSNITASLSVYYCNTARHVQVNRTDKVNHKFVNSHFVAIAHRVDVCNDSLQTVCAVQRSLHSSIALIQGDIVTVDLNTRHYRRSQVTVRVSLDYFVTSRFATRKSFHSVSRVSFCQCSSELAITCRRSNWVRYTHIYIEVLVLITIFRPVNIIFSSIQSKFRQLHVYCELECDACRIFRRSQLVLHCYSCNKLRTTGTDLTQFTMIEWPNDLLRSSTYWSITVNDSRQSHSVWQVVLLHYSNSTGSIIQVPEFFVAHACFLTVSNNAVNIFTDELLCDSVFSSCFSTFSYQVISLVTYYEVILLRHTKFDLHESATYYIACFVYQFHFQDRSTTDRFFIEAFCLVQTCRSVVTYHPFLLVGWSFTFSDVVIRRSYRELIWQLIVFDREFFVITVTEASSHQVFQVEYLIVRSCIANSFWLTSSESSCIMSTVSTWN